MTNNSDSSFSQIIPNKQTNEKEGFRWLHLSDVHLKGKSMWQSDKVLSGLIENLQELQSIEFYPDAVFFTGDAVFGNLHDDPINVQFEKFGLLLDEIRESFVPALPKSSIYIVPGNHDVDRSGVTEAETRLLKSSSLRLDEIENHLNNNTKDAVQWFTRQQAYRNFLSDYELEHLNPSEPSLVWKKELTKGEMTLSITGLNSSWSCCGKNEKGKLRMAGRW